MSLITIKHEKGYRVTATVRNHTFTVDMPADMGGTNAGPEPLELLTAALGSCMAMHIAKYCEMAKLPHEGFTIDLDYQVAEDPHRIGSLTVDVTMPPGIPDKRKEAVKRAAMRCTVKNSLRENTPVDVEIGE